MGNLFETKPESKPPWTMPAPPDMNQWRIIAQEAQQRAATQTVIPTLHYDKTANEQDQTAYRPDELAARIYKESRDAVVRIRTNDVDAKGVDHGGSGTGFFVSKDGKLATAYHVISGGNTQIQVDLADGRTLNAKIVDVKPLSDLAVLQVEGAPGQTFKALELADTTRDIKPGAEVFGIGHPKGWAATYLSPGTVDGRSAMHDAMIGQDPSNPNRMVIDTAMHMQPGNSGSPVLNAEGKVIGVVSFSNGGTSAVADSADDLRSLLGTTKAADYFPNRIDFNFTSARNMALTGASVMTYATRPGLGKWSGRLGAATYFAGSYSAYNDLTNYDLGAFASAWDNGSTAERFNSTLNLGADISMLAGTAFYAFGGAKLRTAASIMMGTGSAAKLFNSLGTDRTY